MAKHPLYNETGLIENNKPHVLYALVDKRAELDGLRIETKNKLAQLEYEVEVIDNAIKIFDPELDITINPKKPKDDKFDSINSKAIKKMIIYILKSSNEPISRIDLHEKVASIMGLDLRNTVIRAKLKSTNSQVLNKLCQLDVIEEKKFGSPHHSLFSLKKIV